MIPSFGRGRAFAASLGALCILVTAAWQGPARAAGDDPRKDDIQSLHIGMKAAAMPTDAYADFACGSNGGPPRLPLKDWTLYLKCPAEPATGLHEVYFRFDDEREYVARALEDDVAIDRYSGTKISGAAVILSGLFDDAGTVKGFRIVTDPRAPLQDRRTAYILGNTLYGRYDEAVWTCTNLPAQDGETPIGPVFIKRHCEEDYNGDRHLSLDTRLYRRPGQTGISRDTGALVPGEFESSTRLEILSLDLAGKR